MASTKDTLKKLFYYVTSSTEQLAAIVGDGNKSLKSLIIEKSADVAYNDRVFFLKATNEIITHGTVFGASKEIKDEVEQLQNDVAKLVGLSKYAKVEEIIDDTAKSLIAKFVHEHMTSVSATDGSVVVTKGEAGAEGTDYALKVDTNFIADGKSIITKDGKLATNIELVLDHSHDVVENGAVKKSHPYLIMRPKGTTADEDKICEFDVTEFVTDGMLTSVEYDEDSQSIIFKWNADGKTQDTPIKVTDLLKIEEIHSMNEYITISKLNNPSHTNNEGKNVCFDVTANVSNVDLTKATSVTFKDDTTVDDVTTDATFSRTQDEDASHKDNINGVNPNTLADAKIVKDKFVAVEDEIVTTGNTLLAKLKTLKESLKTEVDRATAAEEALDGRVKTNEGAIATLNGDEKTTGSVAKSIVDKLAELKKDLIAEGGVIVDKDNQKIGSLITVSLKQDEGKIHDLNVTTKVGTLGDTDAGAHQDDTPDYVSGDMRYFVKSLKNVADADPAFVTLQDAWLYGQSIFGKTIKAIHDDTNNYIHIDYIEGENGEIGHSKIQFDPWGEISEKADLDKILNNA